MASIANLSIDTGFMESTANSIRFTPVAMDKHNRPSYLLRPLNVISFKDVRLDPVTHIKTYISRTRSVRASNRLFVITTKPFTSASRGTLSRWIADIISSSGQAGKGGSCRSAGPSKVNNSHLSLESILEAGEWSRQTTFFRFYCKTSKTFARTVLEME